MPLAASEHGWFGSDNPVFQKYTFTSQKILPLGDCVFLLNVSLLGCWWWFAWQFIHFFATGGVAVGRGKVGVRSNESERHYAWDKTEVKWSERHWESGVQRGEKLYTWLKTTEKKWEKGSEENVRVRPIWVRDMKKRQWEWDLFELDRNRKRL